jgi:hypothetical protein
MPNAAIYARLSTKQDDKVRTVAGSESSAGRRSDAG